MFPGPYFIDRYDAGRQLAVMVRRFADTRPLVFGLPRGGIPVAARVAESLGAPLDAFVVRKLGVPGHEELAMGAIASGGAEVLNSDVIAHMGVPRDAIDQVVAAERLELNRRDLAYRQGRPFPSVAGETVIVVDDGAATGASMRVAVLALRQLGARAVIAAVPVASREAVLLLDAAADECVCIAAPDPFHGVGAWYADFAETTDGEVRTLLGEAQRRWAKAGSRRVPDVA